MVVFTSELFALYAVVHGLAGPGAAHAYLDPATGSMLLQVVLGAIAGAALVFRRYWYRIVDLFRKRSNEEASASENLPDD